MVIRGGMKIKKNRESPHLKYKLNIGDIIIIMTFINCNNYQKRISPHCETTCPTHTFCPLSCHFQHFVPPSCHFQCENLPLVRLLLQLENIPRDLVTWNFLNLNEFWEFVKMCETSPKVNSGKFLKALVSPQPGHRHWTYVAKTPAHKIFEK